MSSDDPRSSSTQSLVPQNEDRSGRRRLLLVFIHGFLGDETSFRSFPAHVHNLVSITLSDSHLVHTKIYPKYKSRYALEVARDDFSNWLTPHEDRWTDVVLCAHSMGGLIAADIAMLFRHRIIGVINFDVPFLGMHPGIIKAGLGSIFKPWPMPEEPKLDGEETVPEGKKPSRISTLFNPKPSDPNFNPSFYNDVHLPVRKGWENTLHWFNKHSNGFIDASKGLVKSHVEFGSAMADYRTLKERYARIRALEEDDERKRQIANPETRSPPRIRFVNYYTTSTGRPKKPKKPKTPSPSRSPSRGLQHQDSNSSALTSASQIKLDTNQPRPSLTSPRISVEQQVGNELVPVTPEGPLSATSPVAESSFQNLATISESQPALPEIPPIPEAPPFVDLAQFPDRAQRRAAEREHEQALDEYQKAVKARNKVIREREDIEEQTEKQAEKQTRQDSPIASKDKKDKRDKGDESDLDEEFGAMQLGVTTPSQGQHGSSPYGNYEFSHSIIMNQKAPDEQGSYTTASNASQYTESMYSLATNDTNTTTSAEPGAKPKKKRLKKFCVLPPKDAVGNKDPTWIQVFLEGVDEVAAHTTLFFVSDTYEKLVGDVGARIESWLDESESLRVAREMEGLN
ncbi:hypothetical protein K458DRAFT_298644 [Lentithecium fluviatile CBS 122367]|uniref:AB hydrolase-1 domain-containing protein n=1 Tax=Lentithecium fluviatile CBS 122367 TaxID=1168545 RepID=A0A6G1J6D7_9PLEO|nr:hypothetical protein K458DRAFT_298644 [Lentithecium fluviatile CBS 122367]